MKNMMIDSEMLRKRLNDKSLVDWIDSDGSPMHYKQGYLSGLIKALAILGEVEYFAEHGKDREPIDFEFSEDAIKGLTAVTGAVSNKIKELELASHSEKDIVEACIRLMESVHGRMMEYMEMMDVEHTEGIPIFRYSYFEIVQELLLSRTRHSGGTSTRAKCKQLGFDSYEEVLIGDE
jgi:hypothetical protein